MKYSYNEIKTSLTREKNSRSSLWVQLWVRKASFAITYLLINIGCTANMVSVLSWIIIFLAAILLSINNFVCMLSGVILTNFWLVLDCVDGNIARVKKVKTFMGDFFDAIAGYGPFSFITIALSIAAYNTSFLIREDFRFIFLIIGAVGAMSNLYMRLIHQKYQNCYFVAKKILGELDEITLKNSENKRSFAYIREQIDKNFGVSGLFMPWLFAALLTRTFDIMLVIYSLYYFLSFVGIAVIYCIEASSFEKQSQLKFNHK